MHDIEELPATLSPSAALATIVWRKGDIRSVAYAAYVFCKN